MSAKSAVWSALALALLITAVRAWFATQVRFCGTPDACFYLGLARGIERTGSFRVNFVYDLLLPGLTLPNSGIEYWRPGVSFFLLLAHGFGGVTLRSGAFVATLAGLLFAAAAWKVARGAGETRRYALPCFVLTLLLPPVWTGSLAPDSTLFYAAAAAWFLALFTVRRQGLWQDSLALLCAGTAYLIRNDAVLLIVPLLTVLALRLRGREKAPGNSLPYAGLMLAGFALALVPMHLLYRHVLGTAFPGGAAQALWLDDLSDFNLYGAVPSAKTLLAHGLGHLLAQRAETLVLIVYRVLAILLGYVALVFLPGLLRRPGREDFRPKRDELALPELAGPVAFAAASLLVYSFVLPAIGVFSALRSVVGVLPWAAVLVIAGLHRAVPDHRVAKSMGAVLLGSYAVSGVMQARREVRDMNLLGDRDRAVAASLSALGARPENTVLMTGDPVQFAVTTGYATVPVPGNGLDAARAEARALGVTHVMLDLNSDLNSNLQSNPDSNPEQLPASEREIVRVFGAMRGVTLPREHLLLLELERNAR